MRYTWALTIIDTFISTNITNNNMLAYFFVFYCESWYFCIYWRNNSSTSQTNDIIVKTNNIMTWICQTNTKVVYLRTTQLFVQKQFREICHSSTTWFLNHTKLSQWRVLANNYLTLNKVSSSMSPPELVIE